MDASTRRKTVVILLFVGIAVTIAMLLYTLFWKESKKDLPTEPPPLPALPVNPPTDDDMLPPPPPALPS